jgi:hypothetical protein
MLQISTRSTARKPDHAVRSSYPAFQLYNANVRLIEVTPTSPGCFSASVNGEIVIISSRQPLLDACRYLLDARADPNSWVVMRHAGSDLEALRGKLGILAKLSVEDDRLGRPKFRRWRDTRSDGAASPIAQPGNPELSILEGAGT